MTEPAKDRSPLLPDRHPTPDFFVCDIFDASPKGDMASMEHPIFSLSTRPDRHIRRYENGSSFVEIQPSAKGLATVHDRDVLIFCISQLMASMNENKQVSQVVRFKAYDLLKATNRETSGEGYNALKLAFERLAGTRISTNIVTGEEEIYENFGLIERAMIVRETRDGRMQEVELKLSDWVFNAIRHNEVLTLSRCLGSTVIGKLAAELAALEKASSQEDRRIVRRRFIAYEQNREMGVSGSKLVKPLTFPDFGLR